MGTMQIQAQRAILEISSKAAVLTIKNHRPTLRINSRPPVMKVIREEPSFKVTTEGEQGAPSLRSFEQLPGQSGGAADTEQTKNVSRAMGATDNTSVAEKVKNPLAEVQKERNVQLQRARRRREISEQQPKLVWDPGHIKIEWSDPALEMEWDPGEGPEIHVEPYVVEVRIRNRPVIRIKVEEENIRKASGHNLDRIV